MDDKKDYKTLLKALGASMSYPTMLTKLNDISVMTEDATLKELAQGLVAALHTLLGPVVKTGNVKNSLLLLERTWRDSPIPKQSGVSKAVAAAHHYCEKCIAAAVPQWMILARNAGWTPPMAKP